MASSQLISVWGMIGHKYLVSKLRWRFDHAPQLHDTLLFANRQHSLVASSCQASKVRKRPKEIDN